MRLSGVDSVGKRPRLTEEVLGRLRHAVLSGELTPGEQYSALGLAEQFGVSRTPVREALLELERAGLVRIDKNRGVTIVPTVLDDVVECFQIRLLLEVPAVGHAASVVGESSFSGVQEQFEKMESAAAKSDVDALLTADGAFHLELLGMTGNRRMVRVLEDLRHLVLIKGIATVPESRSCEELVEDHRDIFEAVQNGDSEAASRAMRGHIINTAKLLIRREAHVRGEGSDQLEEKLLSFG